MTKERIDDPKLQVNATIRKNVYDWIASEAIRRDVSMGFVIRTILTEAKERSTNEARG